jgi:hypothetical protein
MTLDADVGVPARDPDERPIDYGTPSRGKTWSLMAGPEWVYEPERPGAGEIVTIDVPFDDGSSEYCRGVRAAMDDALRIHRINMREWKAEKARAEIRAYDRGYADGCKMTWGNALGWFVLFLIVTIAIISLVFGVPT